MPAWHRCGSLGCQRPAPNPRLPQPKELSVASSPAVGPTEHLRHLKRGWGFPGGSDGKNPPANAGDLVRSLG